MSTEIESWTCRCGEANGKNWICKGCGTCIGSWLPPVTVTETGPEVVWQGRESAPDIRVTRSLFVPRGTHVTASELNRGNMIIEWVGDQPPMICTDCEHPRAVRIPNEADVEFDGYVRGVRFGVFITVGFILALGVAVRIGVAIWEMVR